MTESKTKRIFADVPATTANEFLSRAKLSGTSGQSLIEGWVIDYLGEKKQAMSDPDRKWVEKLLNGEHVAIDIRTPACDHGGVNDGHQT